MLKINNIFIFAKLLLGSFAAFGDEEALVKALQQYQDRLIKEGGIDPSKNSKIYDEIVKPVIKANEEEKAKPKENPEILNGDNGEAPRKNDDSAASITPNEVKPLDFGSYPSPKSGSSKFEIDLPDSQKKSGESEIIFEKKAALPSPIASKKPRSK